MKRNYFNLICSLIFVFEIFSCSNLFDASVKSSGNNFAGKYCICGTIDMDGAVPQQIKSAAQSQNTTGGRAAYPDRIKDTDFDDSNQSYYYYKVWTTVNGKKEDATVTGNTYSLAVQNDGSYTIEGGLFYKQEDIDDDIQVMFFTSENPVVINESNKVIDCKVELKARQTTTGKGKIALGISCSDELENQIYFSYYEESLGANTESEKKQVETADFLFLGGDLVYLVSEQLSNEIIYSKWTEYTSGTHKFVFNFYDGNSADANLIYQVRETVNVFDNMITDCWVPVGKPEYLKDGGFVITIECLNSFELKNIYVDSTVSVSGSNDSAKIINDKKHSGSLMDPFHYLDNAIDKVNSLTSDGPFTIHIASGTYVTTKTIDVKKSFTLEGEGRDKTVIEDTGNQAFISLPDAPEYDTNAVLSVKNLKYVMKKDVENTVFIKSKSDSYPINKVILDNVIVTSDDYQLKSRWIMVIKKECLEIKNSLFTNIKVVFTEEDSDITGSLIDIQNENSISTIENTDFILCDISNNYQINGGLIRNGGTLYLKNVNFYGNKITTTGGGNKPITGGLIYNCFACDFNNVQFGKSGQDENIITSCYGISGGLLYNIHDVLCKNCNFTNTQMIVTDDTIINGAIYNGNTTVSKHCILEDCKIFDIVAEGSSEVKGVGAYVFADSIITLKGTTWFDEDSDIYLDFTAGLPAAGLPATSGQIEIATNLYPVNNSNRLTDYAAKINGPVESGAYMAYTNSKPIMNGKNVDQGFVKFKIEPTTFNSQEYQWQLDLRSETSCVYLAPPASLVKVPDKPVDIQGTDAMPTVYDISSEFFVPLSFKDKKITINSLYTSDLNSNGNTSVYNFYYGTNGSNWTKLGNNINYSTQEITIREGTTYYLVEQISKNGTGKAYSNVLTITCEARNDSKIGYFVYMRENGTLNITNSVEEGNYRNFIGFVCAVDSSGSPTKILSKKTEKIIFARKTNNSNYAAGYVNDVNSSRTDGSLGWNYIKEHFSDYNTTGNYNAYDYVNKNNDGGLDWYIPAIDELWEIYFNKEKIFESIETIRDSSRANDVVWSGTQDPSQSRTMFAIDFSRNTERSIDKNDNSTYVWMIADYPIP